MYRTLTRHRFRLLRTAGFSILAILLPAHVPLSCRAAQVPSDDNWELGIRVLDADLSPDDQFVAVTTESPQNPARGQSVDESVELWDFHNHRQVAKAHIATYVAGLLARTGPVRFTSDGKFVVAAYATVIVVFDAGSLNLVRTIQLTGPAEFGIRRFEISPVSHTAVVASQGSELLAVDLDGGRTLLHQFIGDAVTPSLWEATSISWKPDGSQFAVAVPAPCTRGGEVRVFGGNPLAEIRVLQGKNLATVAFSADRLYAVPTSFCKGSVFNRHLGMVVFNAKTWKRERTILLPNTDLHDSVSYAGGRVLADSGIVQSSFDALDLTTYSIAANVQLTLWSGDAHSMIYTSSALPLQTPEGRLRLSRTGKMALIVDGRVRLIRLP